jgi:hypothetical protein
MGAILPAKQHGERLLSGMAPKPPDDRRGFESRHNTMPARMSASTFRSPEAAGPVSATPSHQPNGRFRISSTRSGPSQIHPSQPTRRRDALSAFGKPTKVPRVVGLGAEQNEQFWLIAVGLVAYLSHRGSLPSSLVSPLQEHW